MREADHTYDHPEEALVAQAGRGALSSDDQPRLERHLASCPACAAELEAMRALHPSVAPGPEDETLNQVAVEAVMERLATKDGIGMTPAHEPRDRALDRIAVERAMASLRPPDSVRAKGERLRRPLTGLATLGTAAAAALVAFVLLRSAPGTPPVFPTTNAVPTRTLILADGSEITADAAATPVDVREETASRTTVGLAAGAARFRVRHDAHRIFRVDAGSIGIEDLGTVFRVAHEPDGRVRVAVFEGRVAVFNPAGSFRVELGAGEDRVFSTMEPTDVSQPSRETPSAPVPAPTSQGGARGQARARGTEDPADLLMAADHARRSRQPLAAVAPLRRLVQHYPKDPRAPSAAFALGWVLLTDLNRPRDAALAFADAERMAPRGALAEDAAARVAEAWQKAGETRRAAVAARHYEQVYPAGRYLGLLRGLIGER